MLLLVAISHSSSTFVTRIFAFLLEFKDSSSPAAWHDEEEMIVQIVRGVVLLGERRGDALNQTMSPWRTAP